MADNSSAVAKSTGSCNWSGGIDSIKVRTIASQQTPDGLRNNQLAWLNNATLRDGGITPRAGLQPMGLIHDNTGLYQGGWMYDPHTTENPYLVLSVSGRIYRVNIDPGFGVVDLSAAFGEFNPALEPYGHATQGEEFMVWQAGDGVTLPLFWDGAILRRSNGITGYTGSIPPVSPLPPTVYLLTIGAFTVPAVSSTVLVTLAAPYPGSIGDTGTLGAIGTYEVTAIGASDFTIETISSGFVGSSIAATANVPFTIPAPPPVVVPTGPINEIPAATCMDYYMNRIWYAQGRQYIAGDIVKGANGTLPYDFRDSVLKVTENPMAVGGDGFFIPTNAGNIRALRNNATLDTALGEGRLVIFTRKAIYSLAVPVTRADWLAANSNNQPLQTVLQLVNGSVNDRSVTAVNGDLYFQSIEPSIRSLLYAVRAFEQPGNVAISSNEQRILQFNDRALLKFSSGIAFNNYLFQTALPRQMAQGVVHDAIIPLDFAPVSSAGEQKPPIWLGMQEGLQVLQMFVGDFGGRERAFAVVVSEVDGSINLWEMTFADRFDNGSNRTTYIVETPAYTWAEHGWENDLKKLLSARLWIDRLFGTVHFKLEYRPDSSTCWQYWHEWKECSPKNTAEDVNSPDTYPPAEYGECYRATASMPMPPPKCAPCGTGRPAYIGYQFQARLTIKGFCRVRGFWLVAQPFQEKLYAQLANV